MEKVSQPTSAVLPRTARPKMIFPRPKAIEKYLAAPAHHNYDHVTQYDDSYNSKMNPLSLGASVPLSLACGIVATLCLLGPFFFASLSLQMVGCVHKPSDKTLCV